MHKLLNNYFLIFQLANLFILTHSGGIPLITSSYLINNKGDQSGTKVFMEEHKINVIEQAIKLRNILIKGM